MYCDTIIHNNIKMYIDVYIGHNYSTPDNSNY